MQLALAKFLGEKKKCLADAEFESNQYLVKAREFQLRDKQLDVYERLALNEDVVLSDSKDAEFNMLLLADNVLKKQAGANPTHASLLAELNMMRLASTAYGLEKGGVYVPEGGASLALGKVGKI
jgi:hypothetical protein